MIKLVYGTDQLELSDLNEASMKALRERAKAIQVPDGAVAQVRTVDAEGVETVELAGDDAFIVKAIREAFDAPNTGGTGGAGGITGHMRTNQATEVIFMRRQGAKALKVA